MQYIETESPVNIGIEGRILNVNGTATILPIPSGTESDAGTTPTGAASRVSGGLSVAYAMGVAAVVVCAGSISWL